MGMHFGLILVRADLESTVRAMRSMGYGFEPTGVVDSLERLDPESDLCGVLHRDGVTLIFDPLMALNGSPALLERLAAETGGAAVEYLGESCSGTAWFFYALPDGLVRGYVDGGGSLVEPWSHGKPLKCESDYPFNAGGLGFEEAMRELRFPHQAPGELGPWMAFRRELPEGKGPESEVSRRLDAYWETHAAANAAPKAPTEVPSVWHRVWQWVQELAGKHR